METRTAEKLADDPQLTLPKLVAPGARPSRGVEGVLTTRCFEEPPKKSSLKGNKGIFVFFFFFWGGVLKPIVYTV